MVGGLEAEQTYPYQHRVDKCSLSRNKIVAYINDSLYLPSDEKRRSNKVLFMK